MIIPCIKDLKVQVHCSTIGCLLEEIFLPEGINFLPKSPYNWEKEGKPMRDFNYHKLAERTWDNEILSYLAQIHEHKSNNWMMHLQGI